MMMYQWLDEWVDIYKVGSVSESTLINYRYAIKLIKKHLLNGEIENFDEIVLQRLLRDLYLEGYSKSTIKLVKLTLNQVFKRAIRGHLLEENPAEEIKVPIMALEKSVEAISSQQELEVIKFCDSEIYSDALMFLLNTGLRKAEFINLKWTDFFAEERFIKIVKSKTKNGIRDVPLNLIAMQIILSQPKVNEYIFNCRIGTPFTKTILRRLFERLEKATGIRMTPHMCRHTFATRAFDCGADIKALSEVLGHCSVSFTMQRYVKSNFQKKRELVEMAMIH